MTMRTLTGLTLSALVLLVLAACGGESAAPTGESAPPPAETGAGDGAAGGGPLAACIFAVEFRGATYAGLAVRVAPEEGEPVGTGTVPPCADTATDAPEAAEEVELVAIAGVSPDVAVAFPGRTDVVLVREGLEGSLPPELASLLEAP
jgi:hypothetical protein